MPGPPPKPAAQRQRRNAAPAVTRLSAAGRQGKPPPLGTKKPAWRKATREWWKTVWSSPMAAAFLPADVPILRRLATMLDGYDRLPDPKLLAEIRQLEDRFGLSPMARRKLQWEIVPEPEAPAEKPAARPRGASRADPRHGLFAVK